MKNHLTILLIFFCITSFQAQTKVYNINEVDTAPLIGDCPSTENKKCFEDALKFHVLKTMDIMKLNLGEDSKAYVQFVISSEGNIENVRVRSKDDKLKKQTQIIIEKLKVSVPATKNDVLVSMIHVIPVSFNNKSYYSYREFFSNEKLASALPVKEAARPPRYRDCSSMMKQNCFEDQISDELLSFLRAEPNLKGIMSPGESIKVYFEVSHKARINNAVVTFPNTMLQNSLVKFINSLEIETPALNADNQPIQVYFLKELFF